MLANEGTDDWKLDDPTVVVLEASQRFAPEQQIVLHWGAGIATPSGVATRPRSRRSSTRCARRSARASRATAPRRTPTACRSPRSALVFSSPVAVGGRRADRAARRRRAPLAGAAPLRLGRRRARRRDRVRPALPAARDARVRSCPRTCRRRRPHARPRQDARGEDRRLPAAREVLRALRHPRDGEPRAAGHPAPPGGGRGAAHAGRVEHARRPTHEGDGRGPPRRSSHGSTRLGRSADDHSVFAMAGLDATPADARAPEGAGRRRRRGGRHPARRPRACTSSRSRAACSATSHPRPAGPALRREPPRS